MLSRTPWRTRRRWCGWSLATVAAGRRPGWARCTPAPVKRARSPPRRRRRRRRRRRPTSRRAGRLARGSRPADLSRSDPARPSAGRWRPRPWFGSPPRLLRRSSSECVPVARDRRAPSSPPARRARRQSRSGRPPGWVGLLLPHALHGPLCGFLADPFGAAPGETGAARRASTNAPSRSAGRADFDRTQRHHLESCAVRRKAAIGRRLIPRAAAAQRGAQKLFVCGVCVFDLSLRASGPNIRDQGGTNHAQERQQSVARGDGSRPVRRLDSGRSGRRGADGRGELH